jgi:hypothetical protein
MDHLHFARHAESVAAFVPIATHRVYAELDSPEAWGVVESVVEMPPPR